MAELVREVEADGLGSVFESLYPLHFFFFDPGFAAVWAGSVPHAVVFRLLLQVNIDASFVKEVPTNAVLDHFICRLLLRLLCRPRTSRTTTT